MRILQGSQALSELNNKVQELYQVHQSDQVIYYQEQENSVSKRSIKQNLFIIKY